jgi:hypothetical protein
LIERVTLVLVLEFLLDASVCQGADPFHVLAVSKMQLATYTLLHRDFGKMTRRWHGALGFGALGDVVFEVPMPAMVMRMRSPERRVKSSAGTMPVQVKRKTPWGKI